MSELSFIKLENLIETRKISNYSQQHIALYLSYDRSYYSKIENGLYELKIKDAIKLCLLLNCDLLYLYNIRREYRTLSDEDKLLFKKYLEMINNGEK